MYRDPSEFRERFKAYKDGKSVREIYGLPGYEPGKLPVDEMMPYILAVENPTKQGLVNGVWRPPTDSTKWDVHAIGGGLDIREQHNPIVYNYLKTNGRLASPFLTAREEEVLREKVFKKTMLPALQNVYNKYGDKISSKGYARLAGMKWQGHPFLMAISPDSVTGKAFIKAIESGDKDLDSVFDAYYKYPANAKRYAARIQADTNYWKNHDTVATKPVPQEPIIARQDATRVATTIPQEKTIPIADPRNATIAEAQRAMWAHIAFENMPKVSDMPIWESPSLPALTPVEYDVTPLKTYAGGKVAEQNEPVITQGRAGSRLDKFSRSMDPDTDDGTLTRVAKKVGKGVADLLTDAKKITGLETIDRFATRTQRPEDYVDAAFLTVGNAMISRMLKASSKTFMNQFIRTFNDMDARALGKYFFQEHPELMTKPQEAWYGELAKKSDDYFRQAIHRRAKLFDKEGRPLDPESIMAQVRPDIKIAPIAGSKYGGIYSAPDNTMLINSELVKDPRTALRVYGHERAHAMQRAFENTVGLPYPTRYGVEMEALFPFNAAQRAKRPGVPLGDEIDAGLNESKLLRSYDTNLLGKPLDVDFSKMTDEMYKEYMDNGYFRDIMQNIQSGLDAQKKFMSKLSDGKLPGYSNGKIRIKPSKRGTFTAAAKKHGASVREFESRVLKNPEKYSKAMVKKARFSRNARSWKH